MICMGGNTSELPLLQSLEEKSVANKEKRRIKDLWPSLNVKCS